MSFEFSQFWPFEMNVLVGADSFFTYGFTDSELRRSGRMTAAQKAKRARLEKAHGKPGPHATRKAVEALAERRQQDEPDEDAPEGHGGDGHEGRRTPHRGAAGRTLRRRYRGRVGFGDRHGSTMTHGCNLRRTTPEWPQTPEQDRRAIGPWVTTLREAPRHALRPPSGI